MKTKNIRPWAKGAAYCAAFGLSLLVAACGGGGGNDPLMRTTHLGEVKGAEDFGQGTFSWKGIPFAAPPVGALRWKAPQEPQAWTSTKLTQSFGNACAQYGRIYGPGTNNTYDATIGTTLNTAVGSEDCLYLNVWRPGTKDENLPVVVFFQPPIYDL